ncbi:MAG TPA: 16S rRNA (cytidine(1402)-2'-O)-methyltransferase [Candidatus Binatia bacterium]|nr:16S rRNA (cytidine(1402)-2'-O)-methyltransferase [Candidatus Binatia bacterium]
MAGTLYVVATPLGNLEDISARAIRILGEVQLIAAEDTRHSRKLLAHFDIHTPMISYYDQIERDRAPELVERLTTGTSIALISDAGTPGIADPGYRLVRAAAEAGIPVVPIPGPSAVAAVLSVCGLPTDRFAFEGFVPARTSARQRFFASLVNEERTIVVYEAARRLPACLQDLIGSLGPEREIVVARELTKVFEDVLRGRAGDVLVRVPANVKGEVTLVVAGTKRPVPSAPPEDLDAAIARLLAEGLHTRDIADRLAAEYDLHRREVYERVVKRSS